MTDIFISYATEDKERVRPLADALAAEGWTVFWDRKVRAGEIWQQVIGKQLDSARCVVVVWTHRSVLRHWVMEEADEGRDRNVLVPASLDPVKIPFGFKRIQSADLVGWNGDPKSPGFQDLLAALVEKIGQPAGRETEVAVEIVETTVAPENESALPVAEGIDEAKWTPQPPPQIASPPQNSHKAWRKAWVWVGGLAVYAVYSIVVLLVIKFQSKHETAGTATLPTPPTPQPPAETATPSPEPVVSATSPELPDMVRIEAVTFQMGGKGDSDEKPRHRVTFARPFAIGRYEVTFDEYDRYAHATGAELPGDEGWGRGSRPVINVSWHDAVDYARWLSKSTGKRYRLPSEAEWEYAARAGTNTERYWGNDTTNTQACTYANVFDHRHAQEIKARWSSITWAPYPCEDPFPFTAPVGQFERNGFGLYDMLGNVWEWVADCYHDSYQGAPADARAWEDGAECRSGRRVLRGGSWDGGPGYLRSSDRGRFLPSTRSDGVGFRLAQDIE